MSHFFFGLILGTIFMLFFMGTTECLRGNMSDALILFLLGFLARYVYISESKKLKQTKDE